MREEHSRFAILANDVADDDGMLNEETKNNISVKERGKFFACKAGPETKRKRQKTMSTNFR